MNREGFAEWSSAVWKLCEVKKAEGYVSALTFANLVYVMRRELDPEAIEQVLRTLGLIFSFADLTSQDLVRASGLHWKDFEDALQSVTADRLHADYIITRNVRDYAGSAVPAVTPAEFLSRFV